MHRSNSIPYSITSSALSSRLVGSSMPSARAAAKLTISGNFATQGGGLWARASHVTAAFSTITGNLASNLGNGGGVRLINPISTMLDHALVAGNIGATLPSPRDDIAGAVTARSLKWPRTSI